MNKNALALDYTRRPPSKVVKMYLDSLRPDNDVAQKKVIDIACGSGINTFAFLRRGYGFVLGIGDSPSQLDHNRLEQYGHGVNADRLRYRLETYDLEKNGLPTSYDVSVLTEGLHTKTKGNRARKVVKAQEFVCEEGDIIISGIRWTQELKKNPTIDERLLLQEGELESLFDTREWQINHLENSYIEREQGGRRFTIPSSEIIATRIAGRSAF